MAACIYPTTHSICIITIIYYLWDIYRYNHIYIIIYIWLVVSTPLKNISKLGVLFPIYGKIKTVPNHQSDMCSIYFPYIFGHQNPWFLMFLDQHPWTSRPLFSEVPKTRPHLRRWSRRNFHLRENWTFGALHVHIYINMYAHIYIYVYIYMHINFLYLCVNI